MFLHSSASIVDCTGSGEQSACDVRTGSLAAINTHPGNVVPAECSRPALPTFLYAFRIAACTKPATVTR